MRIIVLRVLLCFGLMVSTVIGLGSAANGQDRVRLATTTSVQDSGLLTYLLPHFEKLCDCRVDVIAVGSGQALKLASNGDVDLVVTHDPQAEMKFVLDGFGIGRRTFMVNDFVILGPAADPGGIRGMRDAAAALAKIQKSGVPFVSRGDESGTHAKEKRLWQKAGIKPEGSWYLEIGQGMGAVLTMAEEKQAYALCDRATYLARRNRLRLQVLVEGDQELINSYSAIQVNPARFPAARSESARRLIDWFCSPEGQQRIGEYTIGGRRLFTPVCVPGK
jgi:tungstate transport system substrate-binding protein